MHIQWYPGHMTKASRMIREQLKLVDVVIELLDARIPRSSANPVIQDIIAEKPRVIALNKADLADPVVTEEWMAFFRDQSLLAVALNSISGKGFQTLTTQTEQCAAAKIQSLSAKGIHPRPVRAMILGIPNVGKSSLINRLMGSAVTRTADKPGVTRGKQWIKIGKSLELLDTPGVLWPKFEDQEVAFKLAVTGAISDDVFDVEQVVLQLVYLLRTICPDRLVARYNLATPLPDDDKAVLERIGTRRGCLRSGGAIDIDKAGRILLNEFRGGKLGLMTLDEPPRP